MRAAADSDLRAGDAGTLLAAAAVIRRRARRRSFAASVLARVLELAASSMGDG